MESEDFAMNEISDYIIVIQIDLEVMGQLFSNPKAQRLNEVTFCWVSHQHVICSSSSGEEGVIEELVCMGQSELELSPAGQSECRNIVRGAVTSQLVTGN